MRLAESDKMHWTNLEMDSNAIECFARAWVLYAEYFRGTGETMSSSRGFHSGEFTKVSELGKTSSNEWTTTVARLKLRTAWS